MAEDAAARLVQHEAAQGVVAGDEAGLLPERVAGGRGDAADDDVADLALGVAGDDVDGAGAAHQAMLTAGGPKSSIIGAMPRPGASVVVMKPSTRRGAPSARSRVT